MASHRNQPLLDIVKTYVWLEESFFFPVAFFFYLLDYSRPTPALLVVAQAGDQILPLFFGRTILPSNLFSSREDCMFDERCRVSIKQALWTKTALSSLSHTQCLGWSSSSQRLIARLQAVGYLWATKASRLLEATQQA